MKLFFKIFYFLIFLAITGPLFGQLRSVSLYGDYSMALSKKIDVTEADAVGGGAEILFRLSDNLSVGIRGGYKLYSVSQKNQLTGWQWRFWNERYYDKIESDLRADTNLAVTIGSVQKMDLIPVELVLNYRININERLTLSTCAGAGVYFYTRRMYAVEDWSKDFPDIDYTFEYSYRNFAPDKKGNPLFVSANIDAVYSLFGGADLLGGVGYAYVIPTEGELGYDSFIFSDRINFKLGITFEY